MKFARLPILAFAAITTLSGCASMLQLNRDAVANNESIMGATQANLARARSLPPAAQLVTVSNLPYVNTSAIEYVPSYPAKFDEAAMLNAPKQSVLSLMQQLSRAIGYPVLASDEVLNENRIASAVEGAGGQPAPTTVTTQRASVDAIAYQGTVKGLLGVIGGAVDAAWKYDAQARQITFFRNETRIFSIATVPGTASSSADVGTTRDGVEGGQGQAIKVGSSGAQLSYETKLSVWATIKDNVSPMLSSTGTLAISEPTASITVRDRYDRVEKVAKYIDTLNRSLTTQVTVNVTVYRVHRAKNDKRGFNWSVLYNTIAERAGQLGISIDTPRLEGEGLSSLILGSPKTNSNGNTPPFAGSKAFMDALLSVGDTSVVTQGSVVTVNNVPAPFKVFQSKGYLAQTTSLYGNGATGDSPVGAGATLTPGTVETGFSMSVLPSVQPDGHRILLQVMLTLSSLDSLVPVSSGGQLIQVPTVSGRQLMPRAWMRSGQSLVLAGFQDEGSSRDVATPFSESTWALGGNRSVGTTKDALVVVITPVATSHNSAI